MFYLESESGSCMSRVLLIDDDDSVRSVLALGLKARGFEVEQACDGVMGDRLFRKNPADLVITDLIMPEKEGLQTIADLIRDFPNIKIIAMSGGSPKMNYDF